MSDNSQAIDAATTGAGIHLRDIDHDSFAPYGQLLASKAALTRTEFTADLANLRAHARLNLAYVRINPAPDILRVVKMERHLYSAQSFLPLDVDAYVVIVALDNGSDAPDLSTLAAFRVSRPLGINYNPGVWHIGMKALGNPGNMALLVYEDGTPDDCHVVPVPEFTVFTNHLTEAAGESKP